MRLSDLEPLTIGRYVIDPPIILAPMASVSESPYRLLALEMGAGFAPTELVSANGLKYANARTEAYLRHDATLEKPFAVQIFGGDPVAMAEAAETAVARGADIIDVNMGCPVKKVTRSGSGSALMCDPERTQLIIEGIRERVGDDVPVMAKIRAGWDDDSVNAPEFGKRLEDAGVAAIAIHGRTRQQGYAGKADWSVIGRLVDAVDVPVIANGDIFCVEDAERAIEVSGAAGVMIGRAALGNPWIFREFAAAYRAAPRPVPPSGAERVATITKHFDGHFEHHGAADRAVKKFRQHLIWYSRGFVDGAAFRDAAVLVDEPDAVRDLIGDFFSKAVQTRAGEAPVFDERRALG